MTTRHTSHDCWERWSCEVMVLQSSKQGSCLLIWREDPGWEETLPEHPFRLEQSLPSRTVHNTPSCCLPHGSPIRPWGRRRQLTHIQQLCLQEAPEFRGIRRRRNIRLFLLLHLSSSFFFPIYTLYTESSFCLVTLSLSQFTDIWTRQYFFREMTFCWLLVKDALGILCFLGLPSNSPASFLPDLSLLGGFSTLRWIP